MNISDFGAGLPYQYKHRATLVWTSKFRPRNDIDKTVPESVHVNNWCVDISILFLLQGLTLVWCPHQWLFGCHQFKSRIDGQRRVTFPRVMLEIKFLAWQQLSSSYAPPPHSTRCKYALAIKPEGPFFWLDNNPARTGEVRFGVGLHLHIKPVQPLPVVQEIETREACLEFVSSV